MKKQKVFGIIRLSDRAFIETSVTMRGAMIKATKDGYSTIGIMFPMTGRCFELAKKINKKWVFTQYGIDPSYT